MNESVSASVSLTVEDIEFLAAYAESHGLASASAAASEAVRLLRARELGAAYEAAWAEWTASGDATTWDTTAGDGLG